VAWLSDANSHQAEPRKSAICTKVQDASFDSVAIWFELNEEAVFRVGNEAHVDHERRTAAHGYIREPQPIRLLAGRSDISRRCCPKELIDCHGQQLN
jgi:hypothetical protein